MSEAVNAALDRLKMAAPDAAADLHRQITGDHDAISGLAEVLNSGKYTADQRQAAARSLGSIGTPAAVDVLLKALTTVKAEIRLDVIEALGSSASGIDPARRMASIAVLDRADTDTAAKSAARSVDALSDDELERLIRGNDSQRSGSGTSEPAAGSAQP
jgi:HEAT repeat protein